MRLKVTDLLKLLLCYSVSEPEQLANKELKGVAEEDALRKLLSSGEEDEEEEEVWQILSFFRKHWGSWSSGITLGLYSGVSQGISCCDWGLWWFSSVFQDECQDGTSIRSWVLISKSFLICYSSVIPLSDALQPRCWQDCELIHSWLSQEHILNLNFAWSPHLHPAYELEASQA